MQIEAVIAFVFLVLYFFVQAIKYLFDLLTGEAKTGARRGTASAG